MIRITSDGTTVGTHVFNADGTELRDITRIEFLPLDANERNILTVKLTMFARCDMLAELAPPDV